MKKKYIVLNETSCILFSPDIPHDTFKNIGNITSAGFCKIRENGNVYVYGNSQSLGIQTNPWKDRILIEMLLRKEYI
jgi:hypothetical protein